MDFYKIIFKKKNSYNDRLNATVFYINIFLILVHVFLLVFYSLVHHKFMFVVNLFSLVSYLIGFSYCFKHKMAYLNMAFVEIWVHTLLAVCSFGWEACFQNWIFALVVAVFLPAFSPDKRRQSYKQSYLFTFIIILSYFIFAEIINAFDLSIMIPLKQNMQNIIFFVNNIVSFFAIVLFAVTYTKNSESKEIELIKKANFDELTGIYNRHGIHTIEQTLLNDKKDYSIAILDIDFFKVVNDTYGHKSGDMVLKEIGNILESYISNDITVGRWGGEEFLIIANSKVKYNDFINVLESIRIEISNTKFIIKNKKKIDVTVSIGSKYIKDKETIENSVSKADKNLYKAKETGRNKVIS